MFLIEIQEDMETGGCQCYLDPNRQFQIQRNAFMSKRIDHLNVPTIDLAAIDVDRGKLKVALQVPASSDTREEIPFLEVTRDAQVVLFNGARQDVISSLRGAGFRVGEVEYEGDTGMRLDAKPPALDRISFEVSRSIDIDIDIDGNVQSSLKHNPDVAGALTTVEKNFDSRRLDIYESSASQWHRSGGATISSNGETYEVTEDAAKSYLDARHGAIG